MTRPKTYGEYANQIPNVTVDIRVRDREITDNAWRVLNAENELSPDIVEQFNMDSDKDTNKDDFLRDVDGIIDRLNTIEMNNCHIRTSERLELDDKIHLQILQQLVSTNPEPSPDDTVPRRMTRCDASIFCL